MIYRHQKLIFIQPKIFAAQVTLKQKNKKNAICHFVRHIAFYTYNFLGKK